MREILFKAKSGADAEWVEGYYYKFGSRHFISFDLCIYEVHPETVCQFTGILDKNGKKIFEGDILMRDDNKKMAVKWNNHFSSFCIEKSDWEFSHYFGSISIINGKVTENIHDQ